jgi:hypothetical protein
MSQPNQKNSDVCKGSGHNNHLCQLMYNSIFITRKEDYKALVKDSKYVCRACGRTAVSDKSLCDPEKL